MPDVKSPTPGPGLLKTPARAAVSDFRPAPGAAVHKRILLVDDEPGMRRVLAFALTKNGHLCVEAGSGHEALNLALAGGFDVVLTDLCMPGMSGLELLRRLKEWDADLPVIIISGQQDVADAVNTIKVGADDYISKPFTSATVQKSIDKALGNRDLRLQRRAYEERLEGMIAERTSQVQNLFLNSIQTLVHALEEKDPYTTDHSKRVAWLSLKLSQAAGLSGRELEIVQLAALLHDLGKIGINESVLRKDGILTSAEHEHIKQHATIGARILEPLKELRPLIPIIRHHHEWYDGNGYPDGLRADAIPLGARVISIADAFDSMMCAPPIQTVKTAEDAFNRLRFGSGTQFDPTLIEAFMSLTREESMREALASSDWTSCYRQELNLSAADYPSLLSQKQAV